MSSNVSVVWDKPKGEPSAVVVLAHGAGGDLNDSLLAAVAKGLSTKGIAVVRFNFPYREAGRRAPGSQAEAEACYRDVVSRVRVDGAPLCCGGKSYGGRIASHVAADGLGMDGLVFLGYPLHAPGRTDKLRDAHLGGITAPMLFVQGTRDSFARPDLLASVVLRLHNATLVSVDGGDHSLRVRGRNTADIYNELTGAIAGFVSGLNVG